MTASLENLHNIHTYNGTQNIMLSLFLFLEKSVPLFGLSLFVFTGLASNLVSLLFYAQAIQSPSQVFSTSDYLC